MPDMRVPNFERCLRILRQTPGIFRNLLSLATREQLDWRPNAERWSIGMVLAHLADVEIAGFRSRFSTIPMDQRSAECPALVHRDGAGTSGGRGDRGVPQPLYGDARCGAAAVAKLRSVGAVPVRGGFRSLRRNGALRRGTRRNTDVA